MINSVLKQLFKFSLVGVLATLIDFSVLFICKDLFKLDLILSNTLGFIISVGVNYLLSIKFVFSSTQINKTKEFVVFILLSAVGLLINNVLLEIGVSLLSLPVLLTKILATGVTMVYNYITKKIFLER